MATTKLMDADVFASLVEKYFGISDKKVSLEDICEKTGVNCNTVYERIKKGWDELEAVSTKTGTKIRKIPPLSKMEVYAYKILIYDVLLSIDICLGILNQ